MSDIYVGASLLSGYLLKIFSMLGKINFAEENVRRILIYKKNNNICVSDTLQLTQT